MKSDGQVETIEMNKNGIDKGMVTDCKQSRHSVNECGSDKLVGIHFSWYTTHDISSKLLQPTLTKLHNYETTVPITKSQIQ